MTRPCIFCGEPTELSHTLDQDLPAIPSCSPGHFLIWLELELLKRRDARAPRSPGSPPT